MQRYCKGLNTSVEKLHTYTKIHGVKVQGQCDYHRMFASHMLAATSAEELLYNFCRLLNNRYVSGTQTLRFGWMRSSAFSVQSRNMSFAVRPRLVIFPEWIHLNLLD